MWCEFLIVQREVRFAVDRDFPVDLLFALDAPPERLAGDEDRPVRFAEDDAPARDERDLFALELFADPRDAVLLAVFLPAVLPELLPLVFPELFKLLLEPPLERDDVERGELERELRLPAEVFPLDLPVDFPLDLPLDLALLLPLDLPLAVLFADDEDPELFLPPDVFPPPDDLPEDLPDDFPDDLAELFDDEEPRDEADLLAEADELREREPVVLPRPDLFPPVRLPLDEPLLPPVEPPVFPAPAPPPGSASEAAGITVSAAAATPPIAAPAAAPVSISAAASITLSRMPEPPELFDLDCFDDDDDPPPELDELELSAIKVLPMIVFLEPNFISKLTYMNASGDTFFSSAAIIVVHMITDVLIIGAGPTGLALAAQLIRFGVDFRIFDKKETTTPYSKAIGVQARTLEIYEQMGLAAALAAQGWIADKVKLLEGGEIRGRIDLGQIGEGMSPYPFLLIVEQGKHEALVYDHIRSNGKDVTWRTELENFTRDDSGVHACLRNASGETEEVDAKFLVGCDGAHSLVRHKLGIEFSGSTFERLFYVADVEIEWAFEHDALHVNLGRDTLTAFFPMPGDRRWRVVGTFPEGHDREEGDILYEEIERQIVADTYLKFDITAVHWFSTYKVHSRHVGKFSAGRCHLAGDSAHIHTPAGAQGMNTGIQDAYNLAWKLAAVLRNGAPMSLLDTYNEERLPNARRLLQTTDRFFQIAASDEPITAFLRIHLLPHVANFALSLDVVKRAVFPIISQIGINYRASSLSVGDGFKVKAGDRMPWFEVEGASIYARLREPRFHLVVFNDGASEIPPLPPDQWKGRIDSTVIPLYPTIAEMFGARTSFYVILRPDNYIGLISDDFAVDGVRAYLDKYSVAA